jgi:chloramphenicol 3-O-phosphotransferase
LNIFVTAIGQALMAMKSSFNNIADVLLDWDDVHNDDFCSWRGVLCDNVSVALTVVSL